MSADPVTRLGWVIGRAVRYVRECPRCGWPRFGPHYRWCATQMMTRRERWAEEWDIRTRTLRGRCRECGARRPAHKFRCSHRDQPPQFYVNRNGDPPRHV